MNVTIGGKKTYDDYGLVLKSMSISMPDAKLNLVDVPGADGSHDLTEALGPVKYTDRELQFDFDITARPERWHTLTSEIANYLHGKKMKVILDSDPGYYYIGRLSLDSQKGSYLMGMITISGTMEPYKYEMHSGIERWKWDPFNFHTGIIRNYKGLEVNGVRKVRILGRKKEVVPTFISSAPIEVEWRGQRYPVPRGETKIYAISIPEGENYLTFYGDGVVSIDYRGGSL